MLHGAADPTAWEGIGLACCIGGFRAGARNYRNGTYAGPLGGGHANPGVEDIKLGMRLRRPRIVNVGSDDQRTYQQEEVTLPWDEGRVIWRSWNQVAEGWLAQKIWLWQQGI